MKNHRRSLAQHAAASWNRLWNRRRREVERRSRRQAFRVEALEARNLLAGDLGYDLSALFASSLYAEGEGPEGEGAPPTLETIGNQTVLGGAPLWVPLNGEDPDGTTITYTATSSNPELLTVSIPTGNRTITIDVEGFGQMKFELFDHLVPEITNHFVELIKAGEFNKTDTRTVTFHRVIDGFMIQGGQFSPPPDTIDDQFHLDLQHTGKGLLSLAKTSQDDSGTSQFFITDSAQRHLDFNHPIFGRLIEGEAVRDAINNVATNAADAPLTPVVISSITVNENETEDAVLMLKAAEGASGTATVTIRATDSQGNFVEEVITVTITPDTKNTPAFLAPIPEIRTNSGQQVQFQLQGIDAENDTLQYSAQKMGSVDYGLSVDQATGVVTVTPPAGFVGRLPVKVSVYDPAGRTISGGTVVADGIDSQTVYIDVAPLPPSLVDLADSSDSGVSSTDNITNAATMDFVVSGVTAGALVKLYRGNTVIGQATVPAGQSSVTITTTEVSAAGEGQHAITATQTVNDIESVKSTILNVTYDATPPAPFTSTPVASATVGQLYTYNAANPEEGTTGFRYELEPGAPAGITINASTGVVSWTPTAAQVGGLQYTIRAIDAAGNVRTQAVNVNVTPATPSKVEIILQITDAQGNVLTSLSSDQEFFLRVYVRDMRGEPYGVAAGFMDITWDAAKAEVIGAITYGSTYPLQRQGAVSPGLLNEVGAFSGQTMPEDPYEPTLLFSVPMRATASGGLTFTADPADVLPANHVLVHGEDTAVEHHEVAYGSVSATIDLSFGAVADTFTVNEDSTNVELDPLANDTIGNNTLTIVAIGELSGEGTATISQDGKKILYTPAPNFVGTETFTYTIENQDGTTDTATITVTVLPMNDPPIGVDDAFTVDEDSPNNVLDVLANDSTGDDTGETLTVIAVSSGSAGGTITIGAGGANVRYTPAPNFFGTETFTYTLSDGNGGTATATVTVTVNPVNDNPTAVNDSFTVTEDSVNNSLNPLANDSSAPDVGETLTIIAVSAGSRGGTITISEDKLTLIYTPAPNVYGTETFTYTISDGNGGTATATVTMTINNTNDPPTGVADTVQAYKNTKAVFDVLANDLSDPDPAETLTITAVGTPSNGGTVAIVNGKIEYTPAPNFVGTETFTYTVTDAGGLSDTVTVTVNVAEFVPSHISGYVYVDSNGNGVKDPGEAPLAGVTITLQGTPSGGTTVTKTAVTDANGRYEFRDLAPAVYTVTQTSPAFMVDGAESIGSIPATISANDQFTIDLPQDTHASNFNFGERGRAAATVSIRDLFASRTHNFLMIAVDATTGSQWSIAKGTWQGYTNVSAKLTTSGSVSILKLDATNPQSQAQSANIPLPDSRVELLGVSGNWRLYKIIANPASFGFSGGMDGPVTSSSLALAAARAADMALAEGEGDDWTASTTSYDLTDDADATGAVDTLLAAQDNW